MNAPMPPILVENKMKSCLFGVNFSFWMEVPTSPRKKELILSSLNYAPPKQPVSHFYLVPAGSSSASSSAPTGSLETKKFFSLHQLFAQASGLLRSGKTARTSVWISLRFFKGWRRLMAAPAVQNLVPLQAVHSRNPRPQARAARALSPWF